MEVPRRAGQQVIDDLQTKGILDSKLEITSREETILIPITRALDDQELRSLSVKHGWLRFVEEEFEPRKSRPRNLIDALEDELPTHLLASLPRSFDVIGDVAVVELSSELLEYRSLVGSAIMSVNRKIRSVLRKASPVQAEFRLREYEVIAGDRDTVTTHKEYGSSLRVDPSRVYFSPRLSYEHCRVASLASDRENIVDMFAGVGPFAIQIARRLSVVRIFGIDVNPWAIRFLVENELLNKAQEKILPILGDARVVVARHLKGIAHRVIMNLPAQSLEYVDVACQALRAEGGVLHFYSFTRQAQNLEMIRNSLSERVSRNGRTVSNFLYSREVKTTAPHEALVALDVAVR